MKRIQNMPSILKANSDATVKINNQHITGNMGKDSISRRIHFPPHQDVKIFYIKVLENSNKYLSNSDLLSTLFSFAKCCLNLLL